MICECYRAEKNFFGKIGTCWGSAERDACSCGGDKSKCDFYPTVRKEEKKQTHYDEIRAMSIEELADWLGVYCNGQTAQEEGKPCVTDMGSCEECWLDWLKQEAKE